MVKTVAHFETAWHLSQEKFTQNSRSVSYFAYVQVTQWADIPSYLQVKQMSYQSFNRWSKRGIFTRLFKHLVDTPDMDGSLWTVAYDPRSSTRYG